jgi:hypothetical protein
MAAGTLLAVDQVRGQVIVSIDDSLDGNPTVTISGNVTRTVSPAFEEVTITIPTGELGLGNLVGVDQTRILMEPASDPLGPRVSDYVTLTITSDLVTIFFASDGSANFNPPVGLTGPEETGNPQNMFPTLQALAIDVTSDLSSQEVPDSASTIGCFGLALVALAGVGKRLGIYRSRE